MSFRRWRRRFSPRSPTAGSISQPSPRTTQHSPITSGRMSRAPSIRSAPAAWAAPTIATRSPIRPATYAASPDCALSTPRSCRRRRAATPIFRPSWWQRSSLTRCYAKWRPLDFRLFGEADVNLAVAHRDLDRREPHRGIAGMAAGGEIVFVAVPRADDVALLAEAQSRALLVGRQHFFDLVENFSLADRAAGMGTGVLVG